MHIDDVVNSHSIKSQKPLDIESSSEKYAHKKDITTNLACKLEELEPLRLQQIGIEE